MGQIENGSSLTRLLCQFNEQDGVEQKDRLFGESLDFVADWLKKKKKSSKIKALLEVKSIYKNCKVFCLD